MSRKDGARVTLWFLFQLTLSGSLLALGVLAVTRLLAGRISQRVACALWMLVLVRLVLPVGLPGLNFVALLQSPTESTTTSGKASAATGQTAHSSTQTGILSPSAGGAQNTETESDSAASPVNAKTVLSAASADTVRAANRSTAETAERDGERTVRSVSNVAGAYTSTFLQKLSPVQTTYLGTPPALIWVWVAGVLVSLGLPLVRYGFFVRSYRKKRLPPLPEDQALLNRLCPDSPPGLWCVPGLSTPLLMGYFYPVILLPQTAYVSRGRQEELTYILQHELGHLRRHDILLKWTAAAVTSLHWFNPLMFFVRRSLSQACELACDERVVRTMDKTQRIRYSESLLTLAMGPRRPAPLLTTALHQDGRNLKRRLLRVLEHRPSTKLSVVLGCTVVTGCLLCGAALGPSLQSPAITDLYQAPWIQDSEAAMTAQQPWLTKKEAWRVQATYGQNSPELQLSVSLPLEDGSIPATPWVVGMEMYYGHRMQYTPYLFWDLTRQATPDEDLARVWMTMENWNYQGRLRITLLADLRIREVWSGEASTPTAVYSMSTIEPACRTHRDIGVGDSLQDLWKAYPEAELLYSSRKNSPTQQDRGIVAHDACWRYQPEEEDNNAAIFFLIRQGTIVQIDYHSDPTAGPQGLGYRLDDETYGGSELGEEVEGEG